MRRLIVPIIAALWVLSSGAQAEKCRPGGYDISIPAGYQHDKWVRSGRQDDVRFEYDDKLQALRGRPVHDWTSHAADAFRYLALTLDRRATNSGFYRRIDYPQHGVV